MSSPSAAITRDPTTPNTLTTSSSIQFEELDRLCGTPNSVAGSSNATTSIEASIIKAEGDLTSQLKKYATASHHLTLLQTNLNSGTIPKGLTPHIKVTAFMQNAAVDDAVQRCLDETSTKLVKILIAHYQAIKSQAKTNAIKVKTNIKALIEQSSNQEMWSARWKTCRSAAEETSRKLACTYTNKRNGKQTPAETSSEVHNNILTIESNHSMITLNIHTEPTPPRTSKHLDLEETKGKGRPLPERPLPERPRVQRQKPRQRTVQRQRPTKLNRLNNRTLNKKRNIYNKKYNHKHVTATPNNTDNILNLHNTLTQHEMSILSKGLYIFHP